MKIDAKRLGKVQSASVTLAPLTILVGKNNTGKSYIANLVWSLGNLNLLGTTGRRTRRPKWLSDFVKPFATAERRSIFLDASEVEAVFKSFSRELDRKVDTFLSRVFAFEGFKSTKVELFATKVRSIEIELRPDESRFDEDRTNSLVRLFIRDEAGVESRMIFPGFVFEEMSYWAADSIFYDIVGLVAFGDAWVKIKNPLYIPAARTGLMLALPSLVENSLNSPGERRQGDIPLPLAQFLRRMARPGEPHHKESQVQEMVVNNLLNGRLSERKGAVREFRYEPKGTDVKIPLHAVSSMITELAPLVVALGDNVERMHLIFEEPEAHLHLEAQREMARIVGRIVSLGGRVTLTTHSDTFMQQINNLMGLYEHRGDAKLIAKLGYDEQDLINPNLVNAYEFCEGEAGTIVRDVEKTNEGFVVASLNDTLLSLAKETLKLRSL